MLRGEVLVERDELGEVHIELSCACMDEVQRLRPDLTGAFSYAGLEPGRYVVRAVHPEGVAELDVVVEAGREHDVALRIEPATALPLYNAAAIQPYGSAPAPVLPSAAPVIDGTPDARPAGAFSTHPVDEGAGLRRYGLGFTVLGAVLGIGGLVAAYHNPCGRDGAVGGNCEIDVRNTVALSLGVVALGSMTGGITSMAVGQALRRKARLEAGFALQLTPTRAGFGVVARF